MELSGKKLFLGDTDFPFRAGIRRESIKDEAHFVLPWNLMAPRARTLAQYNVDNKVAFTHVAMLQFFAEAFTNACQWRGSNRGNTMMANLANNWADRVTIIMTYVPKEALTENGDFLPQEALLHDKNIAAVVFSFLVMDEELKISHMLSDQIDIERWGLPEVKRMERHRGNVMEVEDNEDEDVEMQDANPLDGFQAANPDLAMRQNFGDAPPPQRTDYRPLDAFNSKFYFPGKLNAQNRVRKEKQPKKSNHHRHTTSTQDYCIQLGTIINHIHLSADEFRRTSAESYYIANLPRESSFHHSSMLSLHAATERLNACGAHRYFTEPDNWRDPTGQCFAPPEIGSLANVVRYPLKLFNAAGLTVNCLPHCKVIDRLLIQPRETPREEVNAPGDPEFDIESYFASKDMLLDRQKKTSYEQQFVAIDPFNLYFAKYATVEADLVDKFTRANTAQDLEAYARELDLFREQGKTHYFSLLQDTEGNLPDGYTEMVKEISKRKWNIEVQHLFQSVHTPESKRLSPLSQWRSNELLFAGSLLDIGDSTLLLFPKLLRVVVTIYLPFMGSMINKENLHVVGPPGSGKSDTVEKVVKLLIPGTFKPKVAGSQRAVIGEMRSQRILEFYNEIPPYLAPTKDLAGQDASLLQQMLVMWGDGKKIYETNKKNPDTDAWESVRQESDNTNCFVGCRNPMHMRFTPNGSTAAIYDRATIHHLISLQVGGRATMAEKIFGQTNRENSRKRMASDYYVFEQRAIMEYCGIMACFGASLPDISLFSDVAPLGVARIASQHPSIQSQLRNLTKIKTRVYAEVLRKMARLALFSAVGLAGQAESRGEVYEYDTDEVIVEMQRYAYCDMETLIDVMAGSMYDMTEGDFHAIANLFATEAGHYVPLGADPTDAPGVLEFWPKHIDTSQPIADLQLNREGRDQDTIVSRYSLDRFLEVLLGPLDQYGVRDRSLGCGHEYLTLPKLNKTTGEKSAQEFRLREYESGAGGDELLEVLLDDLTRLAEVNEAVEQLQPRLKRSFAKTHYKNEVKGDGEIMVNFNYIMIEGDFTSFASSFGDRIGDFLLNGDSIKDLLYRMKRQTMITPYIPVVSAESDLAKRPGDMQSLRYSAKAMREFKRYKLPVLIQDQKCFYLLAAFCETRAHSVINNMISAMTYNATRDFNCLIGVPSSDNRLAYQSVSIRKRPGIELRIAQNSNTTPEQLERIRKQFGAENNALEDDRRPYKNIDIEEERALLHLRRAFPLESEHELWRYTPRGIEDALYGDRGYYYARPGEECPHTIPYVAPPPPQQPRMGQQKRHHGSRFDTVPKRRYFGNLKDLGDVVSLNEGFESVRAEDMDFGDLEDIISN